MLLRGWPASVPGGGPPRRPHGAPRARRGPPRPAARPAAPAPARAAGPAAPRPAGPGARPAARRAAARAAPARRREVRLVDLRTAQLGHVGGDQADRYGPRLRAEQRELGGDVRARLAVRQRPVVAEGDRAAALEHGAVLLGAAHGDLLREQLEVR